MPIALWGAYKFDQASDPQSLFSLRRRKAFGLWAIVVAVLFRRTEQISSVVTVWQLWGSAFSMSGSVYRYFLVYLKFVSYLTLSSNQLSQLHVLNLGPWAYRLAITNSFRGPGLPWVSHAFQELLGFFCVRQAHYQFLESKFRLAYHRCLALWWTRFLISWLRSRRA